MGYEQAFHTCCRDGLSTPELAFQFKAASPGLDETMLTAIGRAMTGYTPPPDAPPAPTPAQLGEFPVSLRYARVDGVGPCVSRTVYVGREDRSGPDGGRGRFGNYFSHVLVLPGGHTFANGMHPIELWEAPFWTADEAPGNVLGSVPAVNGATVSVIGRALRELRDARRARWLPNLFDGLAAALAGQSRVVVLDTRESGWAWVAAAAKCLPRGLAAELTFDTFDGEPDRSGARLCVSVPEVSRAGLLRGVHTGDIVLVDPHDDAEPPAPRTLLGRAVAAWLERRDPDELPRIAEAADQLPGTMDVVRYGAVVALATEDEAAVTPGDVDAILSETARWLEAEPGPPVEPGAAGRLLTAAANDSELAAPLATSTRARELLETALRSPSPEAEAVAGAILTATLSRADDIDPASLPRLRESAVSFQVLGASLDLVSEDDLAAPAVAHRVRVLHRLGVLGRNDEVDRRAGTACGRELVTDDVLEVVRELAGDSLGSRTADHALWVLAVALQRGHEVPDALLRKLADDPLGSALEGLAGSGEHFPAALLAARAGVAARPRERGACLAKLLTLASDAQVAEAVRALYPPRDELGPSQVREILEAHAAARRTPDRALVDRAWGALGDASPFSPDEALLELLRSLTGTRPYPADVGIEMARSFPRHAADLPPWIAKLSRALDVLTPAHADALLGKLGRHAARVKRYREHRSVAVSAYEVGGKQFEQAYLRELQEIFRAKDSAEHAVQVLIAWAPGRVPPRLSELMLERALPEVMRQVGPGQRDEMRKILERGGEQWLEWFAEWDERHPPASRVGRAVSKLGLGRKR
jgi:GTPase-associated protein 1, N-terminal domain type 2/GTPase-associated protein 1, middle domain